MGVMGLAARWTRTDCQSDWWIEIAGPSSACMEANIITVEMMSKIFWVSIAILNSVIFQTGSLQWSVDVN